MTREHTVAPAFVQTLRTATVPELLALVQELKTYPEDRQYLQAVKDEMVRRVRES